MAERDVPADAVTVVTCIADSQRVLVRAFESRREAKVFGAAWVEKQENGGPVEWVPDQPGNALSTDGGDDVNEWARVDLVTLRVERASARAKRGPS